MCIKQKNKFKKSETNYHNTKVDKRKDHNAAATADILHFSISTGVCIEGAIPSQ